MASEIEILQYPDGLRRALHRDELRVHVASEHVENFEIDRLGAVHAAREQRDEPGRAALGTLTQGSCRTMFMAGRPGEPR